MVGKFLTVMKSSEFVKSIADTIGMIVSFEQI